ncbi:glutaminase [Flexivirga sp. ID2601S]|uniref:Glutaminase n=1 Tax=Flexivirga aerilata TaxID=1656889 RepID=A0A849AKR8_9MICO|nr:glutaminase [Flexivirga aerilata]NNG40959.1 glutaminase [Flexivirga aerilata]
MQTPVPDYLQQILDECGAPNTGATADYIPELADADPEILGICLATTDGVRYDAGDADVPVSIQSISKPFVYALAIAELGLDAVLKRVGVEPSGEAFNELSLEAKSGRPRNPMINAGALTTHALIGGGTASVEERFELVRRGLSDFAGRDLSVDEQVYASELDTAYRNRAIANMLRNYDLIDIEPEDVVRGYTRQCAISVTTRDLAAMAATLANGGVQPMTGQRVVEPAVVRQVLSVMMSCGMYDAAGDWMTTIGFPAKSGVSGGILGVLPGQIGIATLSPRLDSHGTSVRGVRLCGRMSKDMGMHIMEPPQPARSVVRRDRVLRAPSGHHVRVLSLQGTIQFSAAEHVLRIVQGELDGIQRLVLDLRRVDSLNDVAERMLAELVRRVQLDGIAVTVLDPEDRLPKPAAGQPVPDYSPDLAPFADHKRLRRRTAVERRKR